MHSAIAKAANFTSNTQDKSSRQKLKTKENPLCGSSFWFIQRSRFQPD
jgi:hypothetical protein